MVKKTPGFTLVELLVVISIIGILATVVYASFSNARSSSRDKVRKTSLKELALAIELYKSQHGFYPAEGCGGQEIGPDDTPADKNWDGVTDWTGPGPSSNADITECSSYIVGLVPEYISALPEDPNQENEDSKGFMYRVRSTGDAYKLLVLDTVESDLVEDYGHEFARCPRKSSVGNVCGNTPPANSYAIYSRGAEDW